jgi:hypothetical protein
VDWKNSKMNEKYSLCGDVLPRIAQNVSQAACTQQGLQSESNIYIYYLSFIFTQQNMPVTCKTAPHGANKHTDFRLKTNADAFFKTDYSIDEAVESIIGSSFDPTERILLKRNGFVDTVLEAYN